MQFKVGETVVHQSLGLGQIVSLKERQVLGAQARLYYEVVTQQSTVWVPVEAETATTLRSLTAQGDLELYRQMLSCQPAVLNKDRRQRQLELNERLKQGTFQVLCEAVRDLTAHSWRKPLSESEASVLRRLHDNLCREWAVAASVTITEANQQINALLLEAKRVYLT